MTPHTTCMPLKTDTTHSKMASQCQECMQHQHTTCMQPKADTAHSKMGSRYQEHMRHHAHHMCATRGRHNPLKDRLSIAREHAIPHTPRVQPMAGFSMPRAHATPHTPHACHSRQTQPTQRWVFNAKRACNITHTTCMPLNTDTTHSKVGFQCQEGMQHHTHHMCATHGRDNPLKDGFSIPRAHATSHTPHACHSRKTLPTQRWILNAKSACDTTQTTCMQPKADTTHSKMGSRCQERM